MKNKHISSSDLSVTLAFLLIWLFITVFVITNNSAGIGMAVKTMNILLTALGPIAVVIIITPLLYEETKSSNRKGVVATIAVVALQLFILAYMFFVTLPTLIYIHDVTIRSGVSIENTTIRSLRSNSDYNITASFVVRNTNPYSIKITSVRILCHDLHLYFADLSIPTTIVEPNSTALVTANTYTDTPPPEDCKIVANVIRTDAKPLKILGIDLEPLETVIVSS